MNERLQEMRGWWVWNTSEIDFSYFRWGNHSCGVFYHSLERELRIIHPQNRGIYLCLIMQNSLFLLFYHLKFGNLWPFWSDGTNFQVTRMEVEFSLWSPVAMESSQSRLMSTWKPTHTDTYLDFNSHHDSQHKVITGSTLLHKASYLPNCSEAKTKKQKKKKKKKKGTQIFSYNR